MFNIFDDQAGFLIFGLVFVSRDFEVGTNVSCEESTVSPHTELFFLLSSVVAIASSADASDNVRF